MKELIPEDKVESESDSEVEEYKCEYITPKGRQCQKLLSDGSRYCKIHEKKITVINPHNI